MRLAVDTGSYTSAMDLLYDANHGVTDAVLALATALDGCTGMSGTDSGGREWAASYDAVSSDLVRAGADLGGSLGAMGNLLNASLVNHAGADYGARLYPMHGGTTGDDDPRHGSERLFPATLPSAFGGVGGEPDGWHWLAEHLQGLLWPDADTGRMRAAGSAWSKAASVLDSWSWSATSASYEMETQRSPEAPIAAAAARELASHCTELGAACRDMGTACQEYASQVDEHHAEIVSTCRELVAWTVVDEVSGAVLSFFTGGGAAVAAQLVESGIMATYAARVVSVLRRLIEVARVAAELMSRGLARICEILARLERFLSLEAIRAIEKIGSTSAGRWALEKVPANVRQEVDDAISRAAEGKTRFSGHDGKPFDNSDPSYHLPPGHYTEWTAAAAGAKRGAYRVILEGDPKDPSAIYFWDHVNPPVRIGP